MQHLYGKYLILDAKTGEQKIGPYFVLKLTDPAARHALNAYAAFIELEEPQFAQELRSWLREFEER